MHRKCKWVIAPSLPPEAKQVYPELADVILNLLWNRGLRNQEKIDEFLNPDWGEDIHDPFLFRDMEKAVGGIFSAIEKNEKIVIHGDYDADGVCGSVILFQTLKALGAKNLNVFLPHRETEGYGVNSNTIKNFKAGGINLIITCDCGISNNVQIDEANNLGMDVIITDHHEIPEKIPHAFAIIHPKMPGETYPHKELSGGAVGWKLACGLIKKGAERGLNIPEGFEKWFLDLAAISLVADIIPLLGEARTLAKYGLIVLNKTRNLGLKYLFEAAGVSAGKIDTWTIGFVIAPRINAAGRMDHANAAYELLVSDNAAEAKDLAYKLNQSNAERQKQTELVFMDAKGKAVENEMDKNYAIAVFGEEWLLGLLGLVAGKLSGEFYRPAVVCGKKDGKIVGSGRCEISGFDLLDSLRSSGDFFEKLGGHKSACGFTLKKEIVFEDFYKKWNEECKKRLEGADLSPVLHIDSELDLDDVDWQLHDILSKLEPFGEANPAPRYLAKGVTVKGLELVGANGNHLRLIVCHKGITTKKMIGFCLGDPERAGENWCQKLKTGDKIDIVFEVGTNEWNGNREIQLKIIDLKMSN
jgi:single-stranded-DNA-specific exonuclease